MKKRYILWADDDQDDLLLIKEILRNKYYDFDIIEVHNGKQALEHLQRCLANDHFPCLIILDINMPVMDGKQTLAAPKKEPSFQKIPVVVFTTSSSELDKQFCKNFHVEMITKPPSYQRLETAVTTLLGFCDV